MLTHIELHSELKLLFMHFLITSGLLQLIVHLSKQTLRGTFAGCSVTHVMLFLTKPAGPI